jgi:C4-dicarboxylate-specific signal transduction histidine kinase
MSLSLAHELRQPLQAIRTASENIAGYLDRERVKIQQVDTAVDVIGRNVVRIDKHIQFLKELGSGKEESETVSIVEVVSEVLDVFRQLAAARNTTLEQGASRPPDVVFNRSILLATLTNLVLNAIEAIEASTDQEPHTIRVSTVEDTNSIKLMVEDDGPGIPEANRSRLFRRQTTTKHGGMGVGLIVWRDAVQMFGGDLECVYYSKPTQFVVTIPREPSTGQNSTG